MAIFIFILCLLGILGLIAAHEYGHLVYAIRNGVEVEEYSIFFGPSIYKHKTKAGWIFKIGILPIGGYVKLKGEHDTDKTKNGYGQASVWTKTKIILAGVIINIIIGIVLLVISALIGMPHSYPGQYTFTKDQKVIHTSYNNVAINEVENGSPAQKAGLNSGDTILEVGTGSADLKKIETIEQLQDITKSDAGKNVIIIYSRSGKNGQTTAQLNTQAVVEQSIKSGNPVGYLGVGLSDESGLTTYYRYTYSAPLVALGVTKQVIVLTYQGIWHIIKGAVGIIFGYASHNKVATSNAQSSASQLHGIVLIVYLLNRLSHDGLRYCIYIMAIISLSLGIINILPLIPLDGGRLFLMLVTRAFKRPLSPSAEDKVNTFGFLFIIFVLIMTIYLDGKWIGWFK